ncbi:MAG: hypothetical protein V1816_22590 [Pseudomonadota bacterium]
MKRTSNFKTAAKAFVVSLGLILLLSSLALAEDYSFKVNNNSGSLITRVLVSQDGKEWGNFDIGAGIKDGATVELVWDESTNNEECEQFFKAVFKDGSESEPVKFNFCEEDLVLEF